MLIGGISVDEIERVVPNKQLHLIIKQITDDPKLYLKLIQERDDFLKIKIAGG